MTTMYDQEYFGYELHGGYDFDEWNQPRPDQYSNNYDSSNTIPRSTGYVNPQKIMPAVDWRMTDIYGPPPPYDFNDKDMLNDKDMMDYGDMQPIRKRVPVVIHQNIESVPSYSLNSYNTQNSNRRTSRPQSNANTLQVNTSSLLTPPMTPTSTIQTPISHPVSAIPSPNMQPVAPTLRATSTTMNNSPNRFYCSHPDCVDSATGRIKSFSRRADLQRHHDCTHASVIPQFSCPKFNCSRKGSNGFSRQDHLIEHRRGYHQENIPKRGSRRDSSAGSSSAAGGSSTTSKRRSTQ